MTKEALLNRARVWLELPDPKKREEANRVELNILYQAVTGTVADCTSCTNWLIRMRAKLEDFSRTPERFSIHPTQKQIMASKSTKYKASKAAIQNGVDLIVLNHGETSEAIKLSQATDAQFERVLASKRFAHNVEKIPTKTADTDAAKKGSKKKEQVTEPAKTAGAESQKDTDTGKE